MDENCYKIVFEVHLSFWESEMCTLRGIITACIAFNWTIRGRKQQQLLCQGQARISHDSTNENPSKSPQVPKNSLK